MHMQQNTLNEWLKNIMPTQTIELAPIEGDASLRRYFRLNNDLGSYIVMDASSEKSSLIPFTNVGNLLSTNGVHAPKIHAVDYQKGFALLDDFGNQLLLNALTVETVDALYKGAIDMLIKIQQCPIQDTTMQLFDATYMQTECALFYDWFLERYLQINLSNADLASLHRTIGSIIEEVAKQPTVLIHRDYHSRNLMLVNENPQKIGVIDFQDAMVGPITYDLVSLLKDCYISWPRDRILNWIGYYYQTIPTPFTGGMDTFVRAFDLCGVQRHLKVLGIFSRLHIRDQKSMYLQHLPRILQYLEETLARYEDLKPLVLFIQNSINPKIKLKNS